MRQHHALWRKQAGATKGMETYVNPSDTQISQLRSLDLHGPIVMLNLLKFKPNGGERTYRDYMEKANSLLSDAGAQVTYMGRTLSTVIGGEDWDSIILVEYPSLGAFLTMWSSPEYPRDVRSDALEDSRLICTQPTGRFRQRDT